MAENFQQKLLEELRRLLEPVTTAAQTSEGRTALLRSIGWQPDSIEQFPVVEFAAGVNAFVDAYANDLLPLLEDPPESLEDLPRALTQAGHTVAALVQISEAVIGMPNGPAGIEVIGQDLLGFVTVRYLDRVHPALTPLLVLLGLIERRRFSAVFSPDGETLQREPIEVDHFNIGRIVDLITDPLATLKQEYHLGSGLNDADRTADKLFPRIADLAQALGVPVFFGFDPTGGVNLGVFGNDRAQHMLMVFVPVGLDIISDTSGFGMAMALNEELGLVVHPFGSFSLERTLGRWGIRLSTNGSLPPFAVSQSGVRFAAGASLASIAFELSASLLPAVTAVAAESLPVFQIGSATGTRLEIEGFSFVFDGKFTPTSRDFGILVEVNQAAVVLASGDGDGFLGSVLPASSRIAFQLGLGWSTQRGLYFKGSGGLEVTLPLTLSIADVLDVSAIHLAILVPGSGELSLAVSATVSAHLGPITAVAERIGLESEITFPETGGNLGPLNGSLAFKPPTGIGIQVNAGSVTGGGFLFLDYDAGRYSGAVELSVYGISVKAFGIIDTKFPDGRRGFSFIIIITAEFTPIQLGFGFTLLGVGGLIGIHRTLDADALRSVIRGHGLDHVLFPHDPVGDAPAIIADIGAIFPAAQGHYVFGPMAKLGWGTPTLIEAEIGVILVLPGPILAVLGEVHCVLPTRSFSLVELNFAVAGVLDFPQKRFSLDASLHDSHVGTFPITGDMAMRVSWGGDPSFALSVGGFHPAFKPPAGFPSLARVSVDLGTSGNPSLTLSGYLAITSNTAQIGARAELNASGGGLRLHGFIGFDALFIFSPFSFTVDFRAGVDVTFHGHGIGLHVHGRLSGPTPWHISGEVCVSVLFWDACLNFSKTFGGSSRVELPALDPFLGSPAGVPLQAQEVVGLQNALQDPRNWSSVPPDGAFSAVALAEASPDAPPPIDPMGAAALHQRVVPLNRPITLFAGAPPLGPGKYEVQSVTLSGGLSAKISAVQDSFAPAAFKKMSDAEKLSSPSFEKMDAGIRISADEAPIGRVVPRNVVYNTIVIDPRSASTPAAPEYALTARHLSGMSARSATALAGLRVTGTQRFVDPTLAVKVRITDVSYMVALLSNMNAVPGFAASTSKSALGIAMQLAVAATPALAAQLQIIPVHEAA